MNVPLIITLYGIKTKHSKIWSFIEKMHSRIFGVFYAQSLKNSLQHQLDEITNNQISFRFLTQSDVPDLLLLLNTLEPELRGYFEAHAFTKIAIKKQLKNQALIMLGAFQAKRMVGYFFLRAGINKKCFVGRLLHKDFRNEGIGNKMSHILHKAAWQSGFRVFATLSPNNTLVMRSHKKNANMKLLKELPDNYWLVEFVKPTSS